MCLCKEREEKERGSKRDGGREGEEEGRRLKKRFNN